MEGLKPIDFKGISIYCNKCKMKIDKKCGATGKRLSSCANLDKHKYKMFVYLPGHNLYRSRLLTATSENEAIKEAIDFRNELEANNYSTKLKVAQSVAPKTIVDGMAYYISYLNNETPHEQQHRERTKGHIDEVERYFRYFIDYLESLGLLPLILPIEAVNKDVVGSLKSYLLDTKGYAPKTYNKYIGIMRIFIEFLMEEFDLKMKNPFKGFARLKVDKRINTIANDEFHDLLKIITPENGWEIMKKQRKFRYKPWLKDAILLTLLTGRRREETVKMKFNGIVENEKGEPISIGIEDFKVTRSGRLSEKESVKTVYVPVIAPLKKLLYKLGYEQNKGKDKYILAPDESMERKTMMDFISKAFTHYYKQLNTGKVIKLYDLRKTYISHLYAKHGEKARMITKHSGEDVMLNHYIDERIIAEVASEFGMFGL